MGEISKKVHESRLKWYGHVLRREEDAGTSDDEIHISARSCALIQRNDYICLSTCCIDDQLFLLHFVPCYEWKGVLASMMRSSYV